MNILFFSLYFCLFVCRGFFSVFLILFQFSELVISKEVFHSVAQKHTKNVSDLLTRRTFSLKRLFTTFTSLRWYFAFLKLMSRLRNGSKKARINFATQVKFVRILIWFQFWKLDIQLPWMYLGRKTKNNSWEPSKVKSVPR